MTIGKYYLHIQDGRVIAFHTNEIDKDVLPRGEKLIEIETENPFLYIGLDEKQIFVDPLPKAPPFIDINTLKYRRNELKKLFYEIQFTKGILEDAKDLELLYDTKLREYNALKNPE